MADPKPPSFREPLLAIIIGTIIIVPLAYVRSYYFPLFILEIKRYFIHLASLSCLSLSLWQRGRLRFPKSPLNYPIALFFVVALISSFFSTDRFLSFYGLVTLLSLGLIYTVTSTETHGQNQISAILTATAAVAAAISFYSLLQLAGIDPLGLQVLQSGKSAATFINTNFLGAYLSAALVISACGMSCLKTERGRRASWAMMLLIGAGLVGSRARGPWMGFIAAMLFYFIMKSGIFSKSKGKARRLILLTCLLLVALIAATDYATSHAFIGRFLSTFDLRSSTIGHRIVMWRSCLDAIRVHPFLGFGFATFETVYQSYQAEHLRGTHFKALSVGAHNDYLEVASDCGLAGLACLLLIIAAAFIYGIKRIRTEAEAAPVVLAGLSCVAAISVNALSLNTIFTPATGLFFWLSLGLINYSPALKREEHAAEDIGIARLFSVALLIVGGCVVALPFISDCYLALGYASLSKRALDQSLFYLGKSLDYCPHRPLAHINRATIYKIKGRFEDSRKEFEEAIKIEPNNADYHYRMGNLYQAMDLNEDALRQYAMALSLNPNFTEAYYCMGIINSSRGNQSKAIDCFSRAVAIDPQDVASINAIGVALTKAGRYKEAIAGFRRALMIKPAESGILRNMALVYVLNGFDAKAVEERQKAYRLEPYTSQIMAFMGAELTKAREYENAIKMFRSALIEDPSNVKARASLATVCFFTGYYDEAGRESSEILRIEPDNNIAREIARRLSGMGF